MSLKIILIILLFVTFSIHAQVKNESADDISGNWLEAIAEAGYEIESNSDIEFLNYLIENPLNINKATKEDLEHFFFLSDFQIENILFYVYDNGALLTVYELNGIKGLNKQIIELLLPFIYVGQADEQTDKSVKGSSMAQFHSLIETPEGYKNLDGEIPAYNGDKSKVMMRTKLDYDRYKIGVSIEKDPGETLWNKKLNQPDYLTGYFQYSGKKLLKKIVVGSYKVSSGQGLALSNSYGNFLIIDPTNIRSRSKSFYGYNGTDEWNSLNGIACDLHLTKWLEASPFLSIKKLDVSLNDDSLSYHILKTGYHRTSAELANQNQLTNKMIGNIFKLDFKRIDIELGGYYYKLNHPVDHDDNIYQIHNFNGESLHNLWISYSSMISKAVLFGEYASHNHNASSFIQGLIWEPDSRFRFSIKYNSFGRGYFAPYMIKGQQSENPSGEEFFTAGLKMMVVQKLELRSYHTMFRNKWLKYKTDAPSDGYESMVLLHYKKNSFVDVSCRYRHKFSKENLALGEPQFHIESIHKHQLRLHCSMKVNYNWELDARIEHNQYLPDKSEKSYGWLFYQDVIYTSDSKKFKWTFRYCHFDTDNYNSRIYAYEPNVLYGYSIPAYSGRGVRGIINSRMSILSNLYAYARFSIWRYVDRNEISTGNGQIQGNTKSDFTIQLLYKF